MIHNCVRCRANPICYDGLPGLCQPCSAADAAENARWAASIKEVAAKIMAMPKLGPTYSRKISEL